jgi:hypothetical protein
LRRVDFTGPHEETDYVRILDAKGEWPVEAAVAGEPFVDIRRAFRTGPHEVVYLFRAHDIIARSSLTLAEAPVSISAPTWRKCELVRLICTGSGRFPSGFPPRLRRHRFGYRLVEAGLIGGFPVKR